MGQLYRIQTLVFICEILLETAPRLCIVRSHGRAAIDVGQMLDNVLIFYTDVLHNTYSSGAVMVQ